MYMNYPHWVYVAFNLSRETEDNIKKYCSENIPNAVMNEDLHCTLIYSKKPKDERIKRVQDRLTWKFKKFSKFWENKDALVMELDSQDLKSMNESMTKEHDFISDYDEYSPHITLTYEWMDIDPELLPPIDFNIDLEHQIIEWLDEDCSCDDEDEDEDEEAEDTELTFTHESKMGEDDEEEMNNMSGMDWKDVIPTRWKIWFFM